MKNQNTPNAIHGNLFHAKLLAHFLIRGVQQGYKFELGTDKTEIGGKFDDIVFRYFVQDGKTEGEWHYRYLQAKHKQDEKVKITLPNLLSGTTFNLPKYFSSYCNTVARNEDVHDLIICTNIGFDEAKFTTETIELLLQEDPDTILSFEKLGSKKVPKRYKLNASEKFLQLLKSRVKFKCKFLKMSDDQLKNAIQDFLKKLVFAVESPNESELDLIRKKDVRNYFQLETDGEFQSSYILNEVIDWLKIPNSPWKTFVDGKKLLDKVIKGKMESVRVVNISNECKNQLNKILKFNYWAIREMQEKILESSKVTTVSSQFPNCTAAKVIAALETLTEPNTHRSGSYLLMPSSYLQDEEEFEWWRKTFCWNSYRFFVVVYHGDDLIQNDEFYLNLMPHDHDGKSVILIGDTKNYRRGHSSLFNDTVHFRDLSNVSVEALLSKMVLFQGTEITVSEIIGDGAVDEIIDFPSMEEFLLRKPLTIPSFAVPNFENISYVNRHFKFPCSLDFQSLDKITANVNSKIAMEDKSVKVDSKGVKWIGNWDDLDEKSKIWEEIEFLLKENNNNLELQLTVSEEELLNDHSSERQIVIVSGLAGAGKSVLMSNQYERLKKSNPNTWVVRLNLSQHSQAFSQFDGTSMSLTSITEFFLKHLPTVFNNSAFAGSLLKHRLEVVGQIILMLDGLDEIDGNAQEKAIQFLKAVRLTKVDKVYVTTRPLGCWRRVECGRVLCALPYLPYFQGG